MIIKSLFRRKARTLLTAFGIAIGVAAVVALGALSEGFISGYSTLGGGSSADILVMQDDALDIIFSAVDEQVGHTLAAYPQVTQVTEMIYTFGSTDDAPYFIVYGYDPDGFAIDHFKIISGEPLAAQASHAGKRSGKPVLLGKAAAEDLDKQVGDTFRLYETVYRIAGIYETGQPFEEGAAVVRTQDAQAIAGKPHQVNAFLLQVRPGADITALAQQIEADFARQRTKVTATTSNDFSDQQTMLKYISAFTWAVSLVAIIIGGVGVMNTVLMSVLERTREFGVLRAIGWKPRRVLGLVLGESLILSVLGGLIGTGLGIAAVRAVAHVPTVNSMIPKSLPPSLFMQASVVAVGLGLFGGALPAWRASRMQPAEAMRAESGTVHARQHVRFASLRNILRQPARTLLTIIGIGVAMMTIILLGAMGNGMIEAFSGLTGGSGANLIGLQRDASVDLSQLDEGIVRRIAALPGVRAAEGFLTGYTSVGELPFFIVFGYQPRGLSLREFEIVDGELLTTNRQIILGRVAAQNLHKEVGQTVRLFDSSFKVVGIYETGVPFQDGGGVVTLRDGQKLFGQPHKVSFLGVWLQDTEQAKEMEREIETRFAEVDLSKASEFAEGLHDMQMMKGMTWGIAAMALVVGGLGMANTMVMSVMERTREIGVLRALGWRQGRVLWMIVRESVALSLLGGVAGSLTGVLLGYTLNLTPTMQGFIKLKLTPDLFIQALGTAIILGAVGGIYPAWRASRLLPVEALRYE